MLKQAIRNQRVSLKWKWAIGTGVGVLVIFGLFSFFLFKILTGSLYSVERHNVENTISQVNDRLRSAQVINYQTTNIFRPNFNEKSTEHQHRVFDDNLLANLTRKDLAVTVYDLKGKTVFSNQRNPLQMKKVSHRVVKHQKYHGQKIIVGQAPIINRNKQKIGYVEVVNLLRDYGRNYHRLIWLFGLTSLLVFMIISIFGYGLASYLLRPMRSINITMRELEKDPQTESRVPVLNTNDELEDLSQQFNSMIGCNAILTNSDSLLRMFLTNCGPPLPWWKAT